MGKIKVIENINKDKFENEVNKLLENGYSIYSLSCNCTNNVYKAILVTH